VLNLHHLRVFAAVAERRGFSRAAQALRVSQPAVSKSVRELEQQVGLPLIDRSGRTPRLTEAGAALYARARELFGVERAAEEELRARRGLERGRLRVAASTTIATYLLPPLLARFHRAHPDVAIRVTSANTRTVMRLLVERRADVALVEGPVAHPRITVHPWREDVLTLLAPVGHPLAGKRQVALSVVARALREAPFIVRERGSGTRDVVEAALRAHGLAPRRTIELGSTAAIVRAVAAGLGLAMLSRVSTADQIAFGRVAELRVAGLDVRRSLTRLRLRGAVPSAAAKAFEELLAPA
jgi:DNA-binding transcriptional LysR family regulator